MSAAVLAAIYLKNNPYLLIPFMVLGFLPPFIGCFAYVYLLFKDRPLLSSEEHRTQLRALDIIAQTGKSIPALSEVIPNPDIEIEAEDHE